MFSRPALIAALAANLFLAVSGTQVCAADNAGVNTTSKESPVEAVRAIKRYYYGDGGDSYVIQSDWLFEPPDSTDFQPGAEIVLKEIGGIIAKSGDHPVTIEAHVEPIGSIERCQELTQLRADKVGAWLTAHKYLTTPFFVQGYGKSHPLVSNTLPNGHQIPEAGRINRRVEIIIDNKRTLAEASDERQKLLDQEHTIEEQSQWTAPPPHTVIPGVRRTPPESDRKYANTPVEEKLKWSAPPNHLEIPAVPKKPSEQAEEMSKKSLEEQSEWTAPPTPSVIPPVHR